jgi:pyrroloquinoline quinone biosynthesis protein A
MNASMVQFSRHAHHSSIPATLGRRQTIRKRSIMMWTKPAATEMRFGFEVTMYVCNR